MGETIIIGTADRGGSTMLLCPRCEGTYVHHSGVTVFDRPEDGTQTTVITVQDGAVKTEVQGKTQNPSSRRDGLAISFWCELCTDDQNPDDYIELTIAQHKGETEIGWRFSDKRPTALG